MRQSTMEEGEIESNSQPDSSNEFISTTKAGRKNLCIICRGALAKYTCPKCKKKTCSIMCVRKHKDDGDCSGKADVVQRVRKADIDENVVRKDFQFVKGMLAESDKVKKTLTGVTASSQEPKRFHYLRKQAKSEYNIKVHQAPPIIERHRQNISFYYMKSQTIYWVVQVLYYKGKNQYARHLLDPTADSKPIKQIMPLDFLCNDLLLKGVNTKNTDEFHAFIDNRSQDKQGEESIHEIRKQTPLREALRDKNVYQYPTLILVHSSLKQAFLKGRENRIKK